MEVYTFFECERQVELAAACTAMRAILKVDSFSRPNSKEDGISEEELKIRRTNLKMFIKSEEDRKQALLIQKELERQGLAEFVTDKIVLVTTTEEMDPEKKCIVKKTYTQEYRDRIIMRVLLV
jgi:hypothetical protein